VFNSTRVTIPTLVRIKPGALARLGVYLGRARHEAVALFQSAGLAPEITGVVRDSLRAANVSPTGWLDVSENNFEYAVDQFRELPATARAVVGLGGGKALDVAKYVAFLARLPYLAVPTSLSNDGFASPQASLTIGGRRKSLPAAMPQGVVVDTLVCAGAPQRLTLSGVGDLAAKFTAIRDWKLAFHQTGERVDDFAALLAESSAQAFLGRSTLDEEGIRLLATSLLVSGIAMEVCGSSRPASGSEHLISHALDEISARPRLHGLQVGVAAYLVSLLQQNQSEVIGTMLERTGFWTEIAADPFSIAEWLEAVRRAPTLKENFFTVLSTRDTTAEVESALCTDPYLRRCFTD
jgi:glycerol-1-phosphate dehydrogenase [NAD(P)+]